MPLHNIARLMGLNAKHQITVCGPAIKQDFSGSRRNRGIVMI